MFLRTFEFAVTHFILNTAVYCPDKDKQRISLFKNFKKHLDAPLLRFLRKSAGATGRGDVPKTGQTKNRTNYLELY